MPRPSEAHVLLGAGPRGRPNKPLQGTRRKRRAPERRRWASSVRPR
jgi:hypothetical protein